MYSRNLAKLLGDLGRKEGRIDSLMVRDGELAEPVREVTIASTLPRMLLDISEIGSDITALGGSTAGVTLVVSEMTMSGS